MRHARGDSTSTPPRQCHADEADKKAAAVREQLMAVQATMAAQHGMIADLEKR